MSEMLQELTRAREEAKHTARTGEGGNPDGQADELPEGSSPLEAREETPESAEGAPEETPKEETPAAEEKPPVAASGKKKIRIGVEEFDNEDDAFKYAEQLSRERELTEAHSAGIREALEAAHRPAQPNPEPEDDFEQRFYANPKETLKEVQTRATSEALAALRADMHRETLWSEFLNEYPDVRRKDAERILAENKDTIGRMVDTKKAMKALAMATRAEYEEIRDLAKPRTELSNRGTPALSPSGGAPKGVTPKEKNDTPLSFAEELKRMKKR